MPAKIRKAVTPPPRTPNSCPHCKWGTLIKSADTHTDTGAGDEARSGGKVVTVWDCNTCDYSEGR
jgi:hypothetical protein